MTDVAEIATRAERGGDARTLILALNDALMPAMSDEQADAFVRLLAINTPEAHLAAAMMLRPESDKHWPQYNWTSTNPNNPCQRERIEIWFKGRTKPIRGTGPTPAHALCIAALRVKAKEIEHG